MSDTPRTDKLLERMDAKKYDNRTGSLSLINHAQNLEIELVECARQLEEAAAREAAFAMHHCESEGCAQEMEYTKRAAEWADKYRAMKAEVARLTSCISEERSRTDEIRADCERRMAFRQEQIDDLTRQLWDAKDLSRQRMVYAEELVAIVDEEAATWKRLHEEAVERLASHSSDLATAWHAVECVRRRIAALAKNPATVSMAGEPMGDPHPLDSVHEINHSYVSELEERAKEGARAIDLLLNAIKECNERVDLKGDLQMHLRAKITDAGDARYGIVEILEHPNVAIASRRQPPSDDAGWWRCNGCGKTQVWRPKREGPPEVADVNDLAMCVHQVWRDVPEEPTREMIEAACKAADEDGYQCTRGYFNADDAARTWRAMWRHAAGKKSVELDPLGEALNSGDGSYKP